MEREEKSSFVVITIPNMSMSVLAHALVNVAIVGTLVEYYQDLFAIFLENVFALS